MDFTQRAQGFYEDPPHFLSELKDTQDSVSRAHAQAFGSAFVRQALRGHMFTGMQPNIWGDPDPSCLHKRVSLFCLQKLHQ